MANKTWKDVWVISKNDKLYTETFKGDTLSWQPGEKKKMRRNDAAMFLGQNCGKEKTKKFESIPIFEEPENEKKVYVSQLDGREFSSQEELHKHLEAMRKKLQAVK